MMNYAQQKDRIADELARKFYPQLFETNCRHCGEPKSQHTTWPARSGYFHRAHDDSCAYHMTETCTCGLRQVMDAAREAVKLEWEAL